MLLSRVGEKTAILPQCAAPAVYPPDAMQKPLPRQTARSLNPPANVLEPYTFFESAGDHPFQPLDTSLNLRNAWWLADAALLAYSTEADVRKAFGAAGIAGDIACFQRCPQHAGLRDLDAGRDRRWRSAARRWTTSGRPCSTSRSTRSSFRCPTHTGTWCMPDSSPRSPKCGRHSPRT